jgi:glucose-1-phosphate thymidylyltransferase
VERRPLDAFLFEGEWFDIGSRGSYIEANLRRTGGKSWIHPEARVMRSTITRSVIIGPCRVEGAVLEGVVVDEGATVEDVRLRDVLIGKGAWIRGEEGR